MNSRTLGATNSRLVQNGLAGSSRQPRAPRSATVGHYQYPLARIATVEWSSLDVRERPASCQQSPLRSFPHRKRYREAAIACGSAAGQALPHPCLNSTFPETEHSLTAFLVTALTSARPLLREDSIPARDPVGIPPPKRMQHTAAAGQNQPWTIQALLAFRTSEWVGSPRDHRVRESAWVVRPPHCPKPSGRTAGSGPESS